MLFRRSVLTILGFALCTLAQAPPPPTQPPYRLAAEEKAALTTNLTSLGKRVSLLRARAGTNPQHLADVEIYFKAVSWMLRFPEETYTKAYATNAAMLVNRGLERAEALEKGAHPWTEQKGARIGLGYRSRVDASLQPYHLVIPAQFNASAQPARLDVVLHGRGATLTEVSFLAQADSPKNQITYPDRLELHVFGRGNNAYRWAGETDVFEALADVEARFKIDPARITLRGFSMGGAGTWHIGLHHPHRWAAIEAGAGFTETRNYAKQADPPPHFVKLWRIYDAVDAARNAFNVPTVGYGGEIDPQLKASVNIKEQLAKENLDGLRALFLVGPKTEHKFHPESKKESDAFLNLHVTPGQNPNPSRIHFVTYTTRYADCFWITVEGLEQHYERAQVDAEDGRLVTQNVSRLAVRRAGPIQLDGQSFPTGGVFEKTATGQWQKAAANAKGLSKRPGLQGPIDDAFAGSFLVVRPTQPNARLERFLKDFAKWMRADPPVVTAAELSSRQIQQHNLILFGDAKNNATIARVLPRLPLRWPAEGKTLAMIYPNPLNPTRYVVLNSGHTFGELDFKGTNALLFPRLGDWAHLNAEGSTLETGFFDERWQPRKP